MWVEQRKHYVCIVVPPCAICPTRTQVLIVLLAFASFVPWFHILVTIVLALVALEISLEVSRFRLVLCLRLMNGASGLRCSCEYSTGADWCASHLPDTNPFCDQQSLCELVFMHIFRLCKLPPVLIALYKPLFLSPCAFCIAYSLQV